jgi:hypothetical protein
METGLRRQLLDMVATAFRERGYFKQVLLQHPALPFPAADKCPSLVIPMVPADMQYETNDQRQSDFRFSPTAMLYSLDKLDLEKADAADEIEETLLELSRSSGFIAKFSQLTIARYDPTPLSLLPFGVPAFQIVPPYGALRLDCSVDFHYSAVA